MDKINSPITAIPGIGPVLGAIIISEFGDISRFDKSSKLVAFAGIDATVSQSGEFEGTHNVMSKRGSPYLRKALFKAALVASNADPILKEYYQKNVQKANIINPALEQLQEKCVISFTLY